MAIEKGESSRAGEEAAEGEPSGAAAHQQPRPPWVVLSTIPVIVWPKDEQAEKIKAGTDLALDLQEPPRPTYLLIPRRLALGHSWPPHPLPNIAASEPLARLLFGACQEEGACDAAYFLLDAHTRSGARLPAVPGHLGLHLYPRRRSAGLIANPHRVDQFIVAQLHPPSATHFDRLLYYCTATQEWGTKAFASSPHHKPWGSHGVLAHDGQLWWVDAARGVLVCDPFLNKPHLRLVPLPAGCEIEEPVRSRTLLDRRRFIRPSEGKLCYVEIRGLPYDPAAAAAADGPAGVSIWTLIDQDRPPYWALDYEASFTEIWARSSYIGAGLTPGNVPTLALLDPTDHGVVYFFEGASLFALDVRAGEVIAWERGCFMDKTDRDEAKFQYSRFVDAWEIPPTFPSSKLTSHDWGVREAPDEDKDLKRGTKVYIDYPNPLLHLCRPDEKKTKDAELLLAPSQATHRHELEETLSHVQDKIRRESRGNIVEKKLRGDCRFLQKSLAKLETIEDK